MGVCRGLQVLNAYYGGSLSKVDAAQHVAKEHALEFEDEEFKLHYLKEQVVNSYHNWGILTDVLAKPLTTLATFKKSEVEALKHHELPFYGIMWHPERYSEFRNSDLLFIKEVFHTD